MKKIIPAAALDDRLGWVGTSGSGKTYNAGGSVEELLDDDARVVIVDPLDVWWGLRLLEDGKTPSPYRVVIFGGSHADLPLTEHAGALIGETVAGMSESCIVSLGGLGTKSAERRFMLAFLEALYRKASGEPFHVVFDEADLWAPQKAIEPMLQNLMEQIVRRGRVKGFIPWLITQRPAVISKDVLSQVDGLIAFKLTSSQDRDALEGWIEGQADHQEWKAIRAQLPTMERGMGVVWIPGRGVLETKAFPEKRTFDSSRTPKRGEKKRAAAELASLDLQALKERLSKVEQETKANDPKALRARIAELERASASKGSVNATDMADAVRQAREGGYAAGRADGQAAGLRALQPFMDRLTTLHAAVSEHLEGFHADLLKVSSAAPAPRPAQAPQRSSARPPAPAVTGSIEKPMPRAMLTALAQHSDGLTKGQILVHTGYRSSGPVSACFAELVRNGWVVAQRDRLVITDTGLAALGHYEPLPTGAALRQHLLNGDKCSTMEKAMLKVLFEEWPQAIAKGRILERTGYASSGPVSAAFARLVALGYAKQAGRGELMAAEELFA